ncbi:hypothetical protein NIES4102_02390 [Chondrocystis sp. NIES-4102]|nr:hypothetical protein NIES4102_02390 [Chondrocystis sp. NIES-4102]
MTTSPVATTVNSPNLVTSIEEISIIIAAQDLTPTMMSLDFLKFSGIIPKEWELAQQPVLNPNFAQLNFTNGVNINAQPRTITISEGINNKQLKESAIASVASNYISKLPHAEYLGLSFSPKILIPFPTSPETPRQYITDTLLGSGAWKRIGTVPLQAGVNLMYLLDRCQLSLSISEARLQQPNQPPITALLFAGNFNYNVNPSDTQNNRVVQVTKYLDNWQTDLTEFRDIVNQKFLDTDAQDPSQSIGETSLFPGQTL